MGHINSNVINYENGDKHYVKGNVHFYEFHTSDFTDDSRVIYLQLYSNRMIALTKQDLIHLFILIDEVLNNG